MHVSISLNGIFWQFWSEDDAIKMSMSARGWTLRLRKYYMCTHADIYIYIAQKFSKSAILKLEKKHFPTGTYRIQKYLSVWNLFLTFIESFKSNNVFSTNEEYYQLALWIFLFVMEQPRGPNDVWNNFFLLQKMSI